MYPEADGSARTQVYGLAQEVSRRPRPSDPIWRPEGHIRGAGPPQQGPRKGALRMVVVSSADFLLP